MNLWALGVLSLQLLGTFNSIERESSLLVCTAAATDTAGARPAAVVLQYRYRTRQMLRI